MSTNLGIGGISTRKQPQFRGFPGLRADLTGVADGGPDPLPAPLGGPADESDPGDAGESEILSIVAENLGREPDRIMGTLRGRHHGRRPRRITVSKYLIEASYTADGVKGVLKEGGSARRAAVEQLIKAAGGTLESYYFVFGEDDVIAVVDLPDNATMAAVSLAITAAGGATTAVRVLLAPEEVDTAVNKTVEYRAPGR
jgi:uncharacterized protein with GYD domain